MRVNETLRFHDRNWGNYLNPQRPSHSLLWNSCRLLTMTETGNRGKITRRRTRLSSPVFGDSDAPEEGDKKTFHSLSPSLVSVRMFRRHSHRISLYLTFYVYSSLYRIL